MTSKTLVFAGIMAAIISNNAMAVGENTVTSKSYVDAMDELKQNKIPATGTNASTPGSTVVTYTSTAGTIGEREFFDYNTSGEWVDNDYMIAEGHEGDILTAQDYMNDINSINNSLNIMGDDINNMFTDTQNINNQITNITNQMNAQTLESVNVQLPLTCANSCEGLSGDKLEDCEKEAGAIGGCTLWEIGSVGIAHKLYSCTAQTVATDCPTCGTGTLKACENNICTCNACNGYNISANSASQCCSGYLISGNKCGCSNAAECTAYRIANGRGLPNGSVDVCKSDHTCGTMGTEH